MDKEEKKLLELYRAYFTYHLASMEVLEQDREKANEYTREMIAIKKKIAIKELSHFNEFSH